MHLVVGLGNPGKKYEKTRHNIGFRIIDELEKSVFDFDITLLKPDSFMNNSGKAVQECLNYYKIPVSNLIVIHDDIDLMFGTIKLSKNSSSAGHKGVQSIIDQLKTQDFSRIRIGIGQTNDKKQETEKFVLENFTQKEEEQLEKIIPEVVETIKNELYSID